MDISDYQKRAIETERAFAIQGSEVLVPLLGLAGEAGELLSEYKKYLRDGDAHKLFTERVEEELGDLLWYIANVASKFNLDLRSVAERNLEKCQDRWGVQNTSKSIPVYKFDSDFPKEEQFPRQFKVTFAEVLNGDSVKVEISIAGKPFGANLTDNSYLDDGYRFHDVFHLAFATVLGWSPVVRKNLDCKRKSKPDVDEVQDGGRAIAIEEGLSALIFSYAKDHSWLDKISTIDSDLLKTIKNMTLHLEVSECSSMDWEKSILNAYSVWRQVKENRGGIVNVDLDLRSITYAKA